MPNELRMNISTCQKSCGKSCCAAKVLRSVYASSSEDEESLSQSCPRRMLPHKSCRRQPESYSIPHKFPHRIDALHFSRLDRGGVLGCLAAGPTKLVFLPEVMNGPGARHHTCNKTWRGASSLSSDRVSWLEERRVGVIANRATLQLIWERWLHIV